MATTRRVVGDKVETTITTDMSKDEVVRQLGLIDADISSLSLQITELQRHTAELVSLRSELLGLSDQLPKT